MKNYIEEFMNDNDLIENEVFIMHSMYLGNEEESTELYFNKSALYYNESSTMVNGHTIISLFSGKYKIEKIKSKTLMKQLKQKGVFYSIDWDGHISFLDLSVEIQKDNSKIERYDRQIKQGNVFLTKSEAEREAYRRKLEFEMQEWARENDCLGTYKDGFRAAECFNVYIIGSVDYFRDEFVEKINKYYKWEE